LSINGEATFLHTGSLPSDHAKSLAPFIAEIFNEAEITANDLDAVAVSSGPGSYTGLRIGISTAKGLCFAAQKPLLAVGTLDVLVQTALMKNLVPAAVTRICAMLDARRMEVYAAWFDARGKRITEIAPAIVDEHSFTAELEQQAAQQRKVMFVGSGAKKCSLMIMNHEAIFVTLQPSAAAMARLAVQRFEQKQFEDTAYFEPFYLKNFVPSVSSGAIAGLTRNDKET
jgi:tRNA threonylcarbamoyladenosine biosynthesis protein TsaB